jgi:hypothetical protein
MAAQAKKFSRDSSFKKKPNRAASIFSVGASDLKGAADMIARARARRIEARERAEEARREGPSASAMKSNPAALRAALKRRQVARISKPGKANPKSRDTEHVFTADGTRYARTDLYRPTIKDRIEGVKRRAANRSFDWWEQHKKQVVVAGIATVAGFMIYGAWKNAQLERQLGVSRARPLPKSLVPSHPAAKSRVGWGLPPPDSYGWFYPQSWDWAWNDDGYDYPFVAAPPSPVVTKGHFAGMPRPLYPARRSY